MKRAAIALALALVAPFTWAATTKPTVVTTTYTNAAGMTTSADVLLRSETTAGAVVTRRTVGTSVGSLASMAKGAVTRGNAVGAAITLAVVGIGWYVDEATKQVMSPTKIPVIPPPGGGNYTDPCRQIATGTYGTDGLGTWTVQEPNPGFKAPWEFKTSCLNLPSTPTGIPQLWYWPKAAGPNPVAPPSVVPWQTVVSQPSVPTAGLPQSSIQDNAWPSEWPELQTTVSAVNNTVNNYYEGDKTNYDNGIVNNTGPAEEVQMPSLNPWQPAIQPLTDLGTDIPKTSAPMSNMPTLPNVAGSGICRGFDVNIPPILVGTLNKHCYYIDNFIRPFLMWFFYMLTVGYLYETWKREVFKGVA
ncbi:hypothetical protein D1O90_005076 [Escherichia coli]|nr:hypothetical protein [Escherichia coli]